MSGRAGRLLDCPYYLFHTDTLPVTVNDGTLSSFYGTSTQPLGVMTTIQVSNL